VHYQTWFVFRWIDFPEFFNADPVVLRISIFIQIEFLDQAFT